MAYSESECTPVDIQCLHQSLASTGIHDHILSSLQDRLATLQQEKASRATRLKSYAIKISALWQAVDIPQEERTAFFGGLSLSLSHTHTLCLSLYVSACLLTLITPLTVYNPRSESVGSGNV